jgi:hypothetical protein
MATTTKISFLDNILKGQGIGAIIKEKVFDEYSQIIFVTLVVLLIIFVVILYKNTFRKINKDTLAKINYASKLKLEPLPPCSKIPQELQYRLCDYFIASSFNTPNLGNQQLDYVSADMIAKALTGGARFIQLPICSYSVDQESYPVIAQSQPGKQHITSLNTLSPREALATIRDFAFKYIDNRANKNFKSDAITLESYNKINYPLIIQLKLHTQNDFVLNALYEDIKDILGKYLIDVRSYTNYPIHLEKLCILLNKIIIISTPGYETSKLTNVVVPTTKLFQTLDSNTLAASELTEDNIEQYYKGLSMSKQRESYKFTNNLNTIITDILENGTDKDLATELEKNVTNNPELTDKLAIYNMIGCTIVEPVDTIVNSDNYNPILPFTYGCQFVAMNYQTPDKYMDLYLKIFAKSSFVLKPSGLRLPITEKEISSKLDNYTLDKNYTKLNINPTFLYETGNTPLVLQPAINLSSQFTPISDIKISLINKPSKQSIENLFIIKPSPLSSNNDLVVIANAANPEYVLTIPENFIELGKQSTIQLDKLDMNNLGKLRFQSFYPEMALSKTNTESSISFRLYNDLAELNNRNSSGKSSATLYYLGMYAKQLRLLPLTDDKSLLTFNYTVVNSKETIKLYHIAFGTLKVYQSGIVSLSQETEPADGSPLQIIMVKDNTRNKSGSGFSRVVRIKSVDTNKYLSSRNNILNCDRDASSLDNTTKFIINKNKSADNEYTIEDFNGYYVVANQNGVLNLKKDRPILSPAVTDANGKIIKAERVGPSLGNNKYFKFLVNYELTE